MGRLPDPWALRSQGTKNLDAPNFGFLPTNPIPYPVRTNLIVRQATGRTIPPPPDTSKSPINSTPNQRKFIIFDHSGDHTTFIFSSVTPRIQKTKPKESFLSPGIPSCTGVVNKSSISERNKEATEEETREEDTDEIDALLYSDSDDDVEQFTGHLPLNTTGLEEEVASSGGPTKRRRVDESDASLVDKASSAHITTRGSLGEMDDVDRSSCVEGHAIWVEDDERDASVGSGVAKRLKRDRIHEAVCVLRRIIPGCKGKTDAVLVLDEAIRCLKSLESKAKAIGIAL